MRSGPLRNRIAIQSATESRDAHGGFTKTWATDKTRWGSIEPMAGKEIFRGNQIDERVTHKIIMRWESGLTPTQRLIFGTRIFHIHSVINANERGKMMVVMAEEDPNELILEAPEAPVWQVNFEDGTLNANITTGDAVTPPRTDSDWNVVSSGAGVDSATALIGTRILEDSNYVNNDATAWDVLNSFPQTTNLFDKDFAVFLAVPAGIVEQDWTLGSIIKTNEDNYPIDVFLSTSGSGNLRVTFGDGGWTFSGGAVQADQTRYNFSSWSEVQDGFQLLFTFSTIDSEVKAYLNGIQFDNTLSLDSTNTPYPAEQMLFGYNGTQAGAGLEDYRIYDYVPNNPSKVVTGPTDYHEKA